jgi:hypothetical protein
VALARESPQATVLDLHDASELDRSVSGAIVIGPRLALDHDMMPGEVGGISGPARVPLRRDCLRNRGRVATAIPSALRYVPRAVAAGSAAATAGVSPSRPAFGSIIDCSSKRCSARGSSAPHAVTCGHTAREGAADTSHSRRPRRAASPLASLVSHNWPRDLARDREQFGARKSCYLVRKQQPRHQKIRPLEVLSDSHLRLQSNIGELRLAVTAGKTPRVLRLAERRLRVGPAGPPFPLPVFGTRGGLPPLCLDRGTSPVRV